MGGKSSKQTTENKPPAWSEGLFKLGASETERLYKSGVGGNTYMGSTVAPLSSTTMSGVNQLRNAGANWDTGQTRGLFGNIGAASVSDPYTNKLSGTGDQLKGVSSGLGNASYSEQNLADMASGKYLKEGNPYFNARLEGQLADTAAQTRSLYSGMGRGGSAPEVRTLTDRLGGLRTEALAQDWDRNLAAMLGANQQMDDAKLGYAGTKGNLLSQAGNMYGQAGALRGQGLDRALSSTNAMRGIDQQNFQNRLAGAESTLKAGNILDQQAQAQRADEVAKYYALDNQDWDRLGLLLSGASGSTAGYGSQIATTRQPMNIGGLLGGVGSLFSGKSDIRAKENIVRVGQANGIPIYEFSYKGEKARWRGTMAQAIPLHRSEAVYVDADGTYGVNYRALGLEMTRVG